MKSRQPNPFILALQTGLLGGGIAVYLSLVGMVAAFDKRMIIKDMFAMSEVFLIAPMIIAGYLAARRVASQKSAFSLLVGIVSGMVSGLLLSLLVLIGTNTNLREMFINASPELFEIITYSIPLPTGYLVPLLYGAIAGIAGAGLFLPPVRYRNAITVGIVTVVLAGLLRDLIMTVVSRWGVIIVIFERLFAYSGLTLIGALLVFFIAAGLNFWRSGRKESPRVESSTKQQKAIRWILWSLLAAFLLVIPSLLGVFFSETMDNVGLYILMGLGLNIVVGFAGLLDLGYVAFFAIGAYTMGVLTSPESFLSFHLTYWQALPIALFVSVLSGVILGLPVLKVRGDYLAIVTLGFGEIVRLLFLSDWLRPFVGGTQGIQRIAHPVIGPFDLNTQGEIYYVILICIVIAVFVSSRLKVARLGRSWMSIREDEDVAQAMGVNLVSTKLLAFATGAFFAGLAGTIFAAKLSSVYAHSMNFLVSINVLSSIIIGGMGSVPGVIVGALAIVGLPELLREFAEFRYLVYGALLVVMMLTKPEGLWPEARRKLELHEAEEEAIEVEEELSPAPTPGS